MSSLPIILPFGFSAKPGDLVYLLGRTRVSPHTVIGYAERDGNVLLVVQKALPGATVKRELPAVEQGKTWFTNVSDARRALGE